jgi:type I restriction-modification system DNA methylase subunit
MPTSGTSDFVGSVLESYRDFYEEIEEGSRNELDLTPRLVRILFCNETLGWSESDYAQEDDLNDVRFYDDEQNPVVIIEAKRRDRDVEEGIDQAFRYASDSPYSKFLIATNFDELLVYRRCDESRADETLHGVSGELISHVNFDTIIRTEEGETLLDEVPQSQIDAIRQLTLLRKTDVVHPERYDDFSIADRQDVSTDEGFDNLLDSLTTALDEYWMPFTVRAFEEYQDRYEEYETRASDLRTQIETLEEQGHEDDTEIAELESQLAELQDDYEQYRAFNSDYETWVRLSNRQENEEDDNKRVFCRESIYVQINKILLIRIAEDKDLTEQMISNGGVTDYFGFWDDFARYVDRTYVDLFEVASEELSEIYDRLYSRQIFDWELDNDDEDLDDVVQKTFWHLNHYDFQDVDRDVLGHLYERHLPPEERKELGEFYTPTAVVDFILDRVGYTVNEPIDQPESDLLDPACGSGTFLVRAAGRLLERLDNRNIPPEEAIEIMQERLWGFDINPFACHITEMNLLFQVIDLYKDVKEENPDFSLDRFNIYQTDSLRQQTQTNVTTTFSDALMRRYERERREADRAKQREDYGFVVMNPPYVRIQNIPDGPAKEDYNDYYSAYHNYDLYLLFIEKASEWLSEGGKLGIITSNQFIDSRYGERARQLIPQRYRVGEMVNIGDVDVFAHATTYPIIMVMESQAVDRADRSPEDYVVDDYRFSYVSVGESMEDWIDSDSITGWNTGNGNSDTDRGEERNYRIVDLLALALPDDWGSNPPNVEDAVTEAGISVPDSISWDNQPPLQSYPVQSDAVSDSDWQFAPADEQEVLNWMEENGQELRGYCHDTKVERGLRTGKNPVFIVDGSTVEEYNIERELVHPIVGGRDVKRWEDLWEDQYIVYTPPGMDIEDYPNVVEYYNDGDNRDELEDRYCVREQDEDYWALDKSKDPELFEQTKIVTPDIAYYNNYWVDDGGEFYCLDTTYYVSPEDEEHAWYLAGVLNSDLAQFYIRRNAATYRGNYLRYKSEYVGDIPIPDPDSDDVPDSLVNSIAETARRMQDRIEEYRQAESLVNQPEDLLEAVDADIVSLTRTGYVARIPDEDDSEDTEINPNLNGTEIRLNIHQSIDFNAEEEAEAFYRLIDALNITTIQELRDSNYPRTLEGIESLLDTYQQAQETIEDAGSRLQQIENDIHDDVYELFDLEEDHRELVEDRVLTPENPLKSKVR